MACNQHTTRTVVGYAIVSLMVAFYAFLALDRPVGRSEETVGTVQGIAPVHADGPPPSVKVWVQLAEGGVVVVHASATTAIRQGQAVRVHIRRRRLTNVKTYSLADVEARH